MMHHNPRQFAVPDNGSRGNRRSIRLKGYDVTMIGSPAHVTMCTAFRTSLFGEVIQGTMQLNEIGRIVDDAARVGGAPAEWGREL